MPITTLDPRTALLVIDLQAGIVRLPLAHPADRLLERTRTLADAFRERGLPVALVNVAGAPAGRTDRGSFDSAGLPDDFAELVPELGAQDDDIRVTKVTAGAFSSTDLDAILRAAGVTQVVITGIATGSGVESTARHAHELGYNVVVVTDAITDRDLATHDHSVQNVFPRMAETGTTADVLALLATSHR
ncbi:hydrolase [Frondihabitans sucicola]|uniref:Hydrolase n=1 Tax=Frondihabitans sucicola TaxID=1268041 RepID=A0ABM8GUN0_9MICO|nr:isochorismatase family protein [Frondihabitans sucicola]BDZ52178.1 hydrolase [Frondihabitans sucicola]